MKDLSQVFTFFVRYNAFLLEFSGNVGTMQFSLCVGIFFYVSTLALIIPKLCIS